MNILAQKDKLTHVLDIDKIFYKILKILLIAANWMLNIVTIYYIYRGRGNKILFDFFLFLQYIALPLHQKNYICLNWYTTVNESVSKKYGTVKNCRVSRDCWLYVYIYNVLTRLFVEKRPVSDDSLDRWCGVCLHAGTRWGDFVAPPPPHS